MYDSNLTSNFLDDDTKSHKTEILVRLYGIGFNLIPMNGEKPCVEWKAYQTRRVTHEEIKEWTTGRFRTKDGKNLWRAELLNFALLTGAVPWFGGNPGIIVLDPDDEEADEPVQRHCPPTLMIQVTGSGHLHRVYRRPAVGEVPYIPNRQKTWFNGQLDRLLAEIPGITNWALEGLRLLRNGERFRNPAAGEKILRDFVYLSSPVQAFLDECCELVPNNEVRRNDLQMAWHIWCDENGHIPGSAADFGRKLRAVVPRIDDQQRRTEGRRDRWYVGVGLTSEAHTTVARARSGA